MTMRAAAKLLARLTAGLFALAALAVAGILIDWPGWGAVGCAVLLAAGLVALIYALHGGLSPRDR